MTTCQKQPDLLTDKTVTYSSEKLSLSDTFTFTASHLATFNERKIVFAETRNRVELTFILGSTHVLYLEQTRTINLRCTICEPQRSEENSFGLTTTSPQSECHEKFIFIDCSSFALCKKLFRVLTDFTR